MVISRLTIRFVLSLLCVLGLLALASLTIADRLTFSWFENDLEIRSRLVEKTMHEPLVGLLETNQTARLAPLFNKILQDERIFAIGLCTPDQRLIYKNPSFPANLNCFSNEVQQDTPGLVIQTQRGPLHVAVETLEEGPQILGKLILVHDMSFAQSRSTTTRKYIFGFFILLGIAVSFATVLVAQMSLRGWIQGVRSILKGDFRLNVLRDVNSPELMPLVRDLRTLIRDMEKEHQVRDEERSTWSAKTLKEILNADLSGDEIMIVSNREPYIHSKKDGKIEAKFPASGLVTALEPVMRACSGTWIAHGSGDADREVVDKHDRVRVPPDHPSYQIRRVWLSAEEEQGYYYGFSNEGMWPLCHNAHARPLFRESDWEMYKEVNEKFARAVVEEAKTPNPVILIQDYHFALLPSLVREKLPNATIITFWHIPWPNAESFGICPWRDELLKGLLGSSILGFHTRFHCNNFVDTVDRYLETRLDRETQTISFGGEETAVRHYPISIEWPSRLIGESESVATCRRMIREENNLSSDALIAVGVDRLDYTKGIIERFLAVERLLELHPEWRSKFSFIQIAAPSRSSIEHYRQFEIEVRETAQRINQKFGRAGYLPIILKVEHHSQAQVFKYFRGAEMCVVTSLHDGMNLVAKEFVAARDDEKGVLILSQFTGAARELPEALIVNPYHIDQCAQTLHAALVMGPVEQQDRMRSMRNLVREYNVYRWAGRMLLDAARMRRKNRLFERIQETETSSRLLA